jgi:hypothetical protein
MTISVGAMKAQATQLLDLMGSSGQER